MPKILLSTLVLSTGVQAANFIVYGPSLYFSERDSPFYGGIVDNTGEGIWLEDFEDHELNTPYIKERNDLSQVGSTLRSSFPNPGPFTVWGVDGDDGILDGQAFGTDVWISSSNAGGPSFYMTFEFEANEDGNFPLFVGLVITQSTNAFAPMEVAYYDPDGEDIFDTEYTASNWGPPEGATPGSPEIQRFIGLYSEDGISKLELTNVSQIDHLQYGFSIPEPSAGLLSILGLSLILKSRSRTSQSQETQTTLSPPVPNPNGITSTSPGLPE